MILVQGQIVHTWIVFPCMLEVEGRPDESGLDGEKQRQSGQSEPFIPGWKCRRPENITLKLEKECPKGMSGAGFFYVKGGGHL